MASFSTHASCHCVLWRGLVLSLALMPAVWAHDFEERPQATAATPAAMAMARASVARENPALIRAITRGGAFGSDFSQAIANRMYSRTDEAAIADSRAKLRIEPQGPRTWLLIPS